MTKPLTEIESRDTLLQGLRRRLITHDVVQFLREMRRRDAEASLAPGLEADEAFHAQQNARLVRSAEEYCRASLRSLVAQRRPRGAIGVIYRTDTERQSHYFYTHLAQQFDAVIHIDETDALQPLEVGQAWSKREAAETFPSGMQAFAASRCAIRVHNHLDTPAWRSSTAPISAQPGSTMNFNVTPPIGARRLRACSGWRALGFGLVAATASAACVVPAMAAPERVPPLVEPRGQEHHVGKVIFEELVTPDLAASKLFYASMFGWRFQDLPSGGTRYATASLDGRPVAGLVQREVPADAHRQPAWLTFVAVRDVDAARETAVRNGAKVLLEPRNIPDRGREAVFADPQGAVFAVLASSSGDPADALAEPGEWIWSSLFTRDPDTDAGFYQTLLDYEVFDLPSSGSDRHLMLASEDYARASANMLPASAVGARPHWINYVRVDDVAKMVDKAVSLGARVLVGSRLDRHGGHVAIVADPQGAVFGMLEWTTIDEQKVAK